MRLLVLSIISALLFSAIVFAQDNGDDKNPGTEEMNLRSAIAEMQEQIRREREEFTKDKLLALQEIERLRAQRDGYLISIDSYREDIGLLAHENEKTRNEISKLQTELDALQLMEKEINSFEESSLPELRYLADNCVPGSDMTELQKELTILAGSYQSQESGTLKTLTKLFALCRRFLTRSTRVECYESKVLNGSGVVVDGKFLRVGELASFYITAAGDEAGIFMRSAVDEGSGRYDRTIPSGLIDKIDSAAKTPEGEIAELPLDVSGEMAAGTSRLQGGIIEHLTRGGPVVIPLLLLAVLAAILIIERFISLRRESKTAAKFAQEIIETYRSKGLQPALSLAGGGRSAVARVLKAGLEKADTPADIFEETMHEAALAEIPRLERFLSTIAVLATVAPLMGLLGTVTGMISAFETITAYGTSDPRLLSGGISEALVTTELGLVIAIPLLLLHGFLSAKVDRISADLEMASSSMLAAVTEVSAEQEKPVD